MIKRFNYKVHVYPVLFWVNVKGFSLSGLSRGQGQPTPVLAGLLQFMTVNRGIQALSFFMGGGGGAAVAKSHSNICVNMQDRQIEISLQHHNHL